jgi:pimeloyl-ACP methyl ester carboxylesterase
MKERVLRVGKPTPLAGVTTEPATIDPARPAVIILNSGVMHHVGSCRLSVKLARSIAADGTLAVRFDYSGIGDSESRRGTPSFEEVSVTECAEVMDHLQRTRGIERFILYGLCSGADAAYNTALRDPRVVGVSQFDPYCYVTPKFYLRYYLPIVTDLRRWKSFLGRKMAALTKGGEAPAAAHDRELLEITTNVRVFPPRESVAAGLRTLVGRGVRLQVNFPAGPLYNYRAQFRDSFPEVPFDDAIEVNYYARANHIVTQPDEQAVVVRDITQWITRVATLGAAAR